MLCVLLHVLYSLKVGSCAQNTESDGTVRACAVYVVVTVRSVPLEKQRCGIRLTACSMVWNSIRVRWRHWSRLRKISVLVTRLLSLYDIRMIVKLSLYA